MNRRPLVGALVVLAALGAAPSGAEEPLTLAAAVARALDRYPALEAARARVEQAEQSAGEARADHGPLLFATLFGSRSREPVPVTPIHGFGLEEFPAFDATLIQGSVQVDYTLFDSGVRRYKVRQADARIEAERAALDAGEQAIAARVAALYARILAGRQSVEAQRTRVGALRAELGRVEQLLAVGRAPELDRFRAEAALAAAEADVTRAATELDLDQRGLARYIEQPPEATRAERLAEIPDPEPPTALRAELESAAIAASGEIVRARAAVDAAAAGRALARTAYFPKLRTSGVYQQLGGSALAFGTEWNAALKLTVPLWDGGATDRRVARAGAALDEAHAALAQAALEVRDTVDRALGAWTDAAARADALARAEARLAEVARIQQLLLDVGKGTQIDFLAAESELASTRAALAETRSVAVAARVELARATGELSLDWLVRNLENRR